MAATAISSNALKCDSDPSADVAPSRPPAGGQAISLTGQFARYTLVGAVAALVNISLYAVCWRLFAGVHVAADYLLADVVGFFGGMTLNYQLSVRWVFPRRRLASRRLEYALFAIIGALGLLLSQVMLWTLVGRLGWQRDLAKVIALAALLVWNFGTRKAVLFR